MYNIFHYNNKPIFNHDVRYLLFNSFPKYQFFGYIIANIVGISIILIGVLFYCDSLKSKSDYDDNYLSEDYIILSKKIEGIGFSKISFSNNEINKLREQKWVLKIGYFTSSRFTVYGTVNMGVNEISSYLFLESAPDDFFDILPSKWNFNPNEKFIPLILCKDYLTLYNFGFAIPQGLPQISEKFIGTIPITLRITGNNGLIETFKAEVVGFSSRLNTISVPQSFMNWANNHFSNGAPQNPSRLIVKVNTFETSSMKKYLEKEEIEIGGEKDRTSNISTFLSIVSSVITINGLIISGLSLFILLLSIYFLLYKNKSTLKKLMLLGYSPNYISKYYETLVLCTNFTTTLVSIFIVFFVRLLWLDKLKEIGLGGQTILPVFAISVLYFTTISMINISLVKKQIIQIWDNT